MFPVRGQQQYSYRKITVEIISAFTTSFLGHVLHWLRETINNTIINLATPTHTSLPIEGNIIILRQ